MYFHPGNKLLAFFYQVKNFWYTLHCFFLPSQVWPGHLWIYPYHIIMERSCPSVIGLEYIFATLDSLGLGMTCNVCFIKYQVLRQVYKFKTETTILNSLLELDITKIKKDNFQCLQKSCVHWLIWTFVIIRWTRWLYPK